LPVRLCQTRCPLTTLEKARSDQWPLNPLNPNVDLVRRGYEAYAERDLLKVVSLFDPEIEIVQTTELPCDKALLAE